MLLAYLLLMTTPPFVAATQSAYVQQDADRLRTLFDQAETRADSLLVRYRLYPLTEDPEVLDGIPTSLTDGTAREYALLSGLWAYRAGEGSFLSAIRYGKRSTHLLERARSLDPNAPFVLLVEGQSLLFRPAIAGRDPAGAADCFSALAEIVSENDVSGISRTEAEIWQWLALGEAGRTEEAESLWQQLRTQDLPPLYQQFLDDPPEV